MSTNTWDGLSKPAQVTASKPWRYSTFAIGRKRTPAWRTVFSDMPGWLVSLTVHAVAVVMLALISVGSSITAHTQFLSIFEGEATADFESMPLVASSVEDIRVDFVGTYNTSVEGYSDVGSVVADGVFSGEAIEGDFSQPTLRIKGAEGLDGRELRGTSSSKTRRAEFYGIEAEGESFVFIVDRSNSMRGEKLLEAKQELIYAIRRLSPEQKFYVIFFAGNSEFMHFAQKQEPELQPVFATMENLNKLEAWVASVQVEPWTNPFDAVKFALQIAPDAIFLLTDGEFTDRGQTVRYLQNRNVVKEPGEAKRPKVVINSIGFHSREGEQTLKRISSQYGGTYRFVPPKNFAMGRR